MAYAVSIGVVALFVVIYFLMRRHVKPVYCKNIGDAEFEAEANKLVRALPLPKKRAEVPSLAFNIKCNILKLKSRRYCGKFDDLIVSKDKLKEMCATPLLGALPSVDGVPRCVRLAKFCLEMSGGRADESRIRTVLESQNEWRTLTFSEIEALAQAFKYALTQQLASLYEKMYTVAKFEDIAKRYVYSRGRTGKKYEKFAKDKLFLSLCASVAGYKSDIYQATLRELRAKFGNELERIMSALDIVERMDFSPYYSPLEIYDKYDMFSSSDEGTKRNFLTLASEISDRENLDEFLFAVRVDRYMLSASSGHMAIARFKIFDSMMSFIKQKRDVSMLGVALSSRYFMDLYFKPVKRRFLSRSITKINEYENSFEPIYKFKTVNFGISASDGKLKLSPRLPLGVTSADINFEYGGVRHTIHLKRGEERAMYIGDTRINGVDAIPLGDKSLDITLTVQDKTR